MRFLIITALLAAVLAIATDDRPSGTVRIPMEQAFPKFERPGVGRGRFLDVPSWSISPATSHSGSFIGGQFAGPATLASGKPTYLTFDGQPVRWEERTDAASSSRRPVSAGYHVPRFMHPSSGRRWGPFPLGEDRFTAKSYPLDFPLFEHFYRDNTLRPANFEDYLVDKPFSTRYEDDGPNASRTPTPGGKRINAVGIEFAPEPSVLRAVQNTIWRSLKAAGIHPQRVTFPNMRESEVTQGEYLWPPVRVPFEGEGTELVFPRKLLSDRYRIAISRRLHTGTSEDGRMFHLETQVNGVTRHILMMPARSGAHMIGGPAKEDSKMWVLLEAMVTPREEAVHPQRFALLGATFLPRSAQKVLQEAGVWRPAFPGSLNAPHELR